MTSPGTAPDWDVSDIAAYYKFLQCLKLKVEGIIGSSAGPDLATFFARTLVLICPDGGLPAQCAGNKATLSAGCQACGITPADTTSEMSNANRTFGEFLDTISGFKIVDRWLALFKQIAIETKPDCQSMIEFLEAGNLANLNCEDVLPAGAWTQIVPLLGAQGVPANLVPWPTSPIFVQGRKLADAIDLINGKDISL